MIEMKGYRVELTELCQKQIDDIRCHLKYDLFSPSAAGKFIESTRQLVLSLESYPYRFAARPYSLKYGEYEMRQVCYTMNYTAYYVINEHEKIVTIAEIRYSKEDISDL